MKRFEVVITTHSPVLSALDVLARTKSMPEIRQYRWRWRARLKCWLVHSTPVPFFGGYQIATWRPILRVVDKTARHAA